MRFINITGGEPFLRQDIAEIIEAIRPKTRRIVISTNGFFTDRIVGLCQKHPDLGIRISIEGFQKANDTIRGIPVISDRVDVEDIKLNNSFVGNFFRCSVEFMPHVKSGEYDVAFANYVLEHVRDINMAASEIRRILKPGGIFVTSIPNPQAPEFVISRLTPLWFHKIIRKRESWETYYSYESVKQLRKVFNKAGFEMIDVLYWSFVQGYPKRFPVINRMSCVYDKLMDFLKLKHFMNNVCIVFKKPLK